MPKKVLVLISGWKESGKDTVFGLLQRKYGFRRFAFADLLKDQAAPIYKFERTELDSTEMKKKPILTRPVIAKDKFSETVQDMIYTHFSTAAGICPSPDEDKLLFLTRKNEVLHWKNDTLFWTRRAALVMHGSTGRTFNPDIWIEDPLDIMRSHDFICGTDCRYENEINRTKEYMGQEYEIKIIRVDTIKPPTSSDESERSLDDYQHFDLRILNKHDGIEKFYEEIESKITGILGF